MFENREQVTIELSESAMQRYAVSFSQVASAIRNNSINLSSGRVRTETGDVRLRARNLADTDVDFQQIVIVQNRDGGSIRVGDVARVIDGFEDNDVIARIAGERAGIIQVKGTDNMQVVKLSDTVRAWMEEREKTLPTGVSLTLWQDDADIYKARMATIGKSAYLGLGLVFLLLILTLRPAVALWVTVGIGIAFMGTFALLPPTDVSLNIISTFGFLLVLGIVVDDAIVVGESIHEQTKRLGGGAGGAIEGAALVAKPVIFAVLTTMIVFAPWFFLSGAAAQLTQQLSIVITVALCISLIEAFFILPAHLRKLRPRDRTQLGRLATLQNNIALSISSFADIRYRQWIGNVIENRYATVATFLAFLLISLGIFNNGWVASSFAPEVEGEQIWIDVDLPAGTPFARSLDVMQKLEAAELQLIDEVESMASENRRSGKLIEGWFSVAQRGKVFAGVKLVPPETRDLSTSEVAERFRELVGEMPEADRVQFLYTLSDNDPQLSYLLRHPDMAVLRAASKELQARLNSYEGTFFTRDNLRGEVDELHLALLPGAEKLGVTLTEISYQVRQAYYGEEVQRLPREYGDTKVMVRYPKELRSNLESLSSFRVRTNDGRELPLMSVVDVSLASGVQRIKRRDGMRMVRVSARVNDERTSDIDDDINDNFLDDLAARHPGLLIDKSGRLGKAEEFFDEIRTLYTIALFSMYALIAIAFGSYFLPLLVMTAIPFSFTGAIYGHLLFDMSVSMYSYFGIGAAAGVVVNDNLVLVDRIGTLRKQGLSAMDSIVESTVQRFRPILLTSVTTFVGLMPLMAERSIDAQFLKPAGLALAFGVLFALFVTLLLVPALYCIGEDIKRSSVNAKARIKALMV
jgi:multidrug efflux pump subunit AcrB